MTNLLHGLPRPLPGERVLGVHPMIAPQVEDPIGARARTSSLAVPSTCVRWTRKGRTARGRSRTRDSALGPDHKGELALDVRGDRGEPHLPLPNELSPSAFVLEAADE